MSQRLHHQTKDTEGPCIHCGMLRDEFLRAGDTYCITDAYYSADYLRITSGGAIKRCVDFIKEKDIIQEIYG